MRSIGYQPGGKQVRSWTAGLARLVAGASIAAALTAATCIPAGCYAAGTHAAANRPATAGAELPDAIVATATHYLGAPYATIGDSPASGFSCIGFVHFIFAQLGISVPYDIPAAWHSAPHVASTDLLPGDVLFFSNTVFPGLSHVAIYIGHDRMIGADNVSVGVTTDTLTDRYWMAHYTGATRPLSTMGTAPAVDAAQPVATAPPEAPTRASAPAPAGTRVRPLPRALEIYSGPGDQYIPLELVTPHTTLTVVQAQQGWYGVRFRAATGGVLFGWVTTVEVASIEGRATPSERVSAAAADTPPPPHMAPAGETLRVTATVLNVRSGPRESAPVISVLFTDEVVLVLAHAQGWDQVRLRSGVIGWASATWLAMKR